MVDQQNPFALEIDLVGWRDRRGRFAKLDDAALSEQKVVLDRLGDQLLGIIRRESPRAKVHQAGKPRFAESWRKRITSGERGAGLVIDNTDPKAPVVFGPTRAHLITPHHARVLHFPARGGGSVFARRVHHPGTKANDVLGRSVEHGESLIRDAAGRYAATVQRRVVGVWDSE